MEGEARECLKIKGMKITIDLENNVLETEGDVPKSLVEAIVYAVRDWKDQQQEQKLTVPALFYVITITG